MGFSASVRDCYTNVLLMSELGGIAIHAADRDPEDTGHRRGGPVPSNPELLAPFIRSVRNRDGAAQPDRWSATVEIDARSAFRAVTSWPDCATVDWAYVPRFYDPIPRKTVRFSRSADSREEVPEELSPA